MDKRYLNTNTSTGFPAPTSTAHHVPDSWGVWPVARPWLEVVSNVQGPGVNMNRNLMTLPVQVRGVGNLGNSIAFQRLGIKRSQRGIPSLEMTSSGDQTSVPS